MSVSDGPVSRCAAGQQGNALPGDAWSPLLLAVARNRDRAAFEQLFTHFAPRVKAYMLRAGLAPDAAEEIAQEALVSVWRKAELFDAARAGATTWIFAIARNLRIDAARRDSRSNAFLDRDADSLGKADPAPLSEALMLAAESDRLVRGALAALPQDQAAIIRLSFFEGQPHASIARELGIPLGTVKSRVRLAVGRLRKLLEDAS